MDNIELTEPRLHYREPPMLLKNEPKGFRNVLAQAGRVFSVPMPARGAAFGDFDNDGFIDVAINCNDSSALILRNVCNRQNHWLTLNLVGTTSNHDGIGSKVRLVTDDGKQQTTFVSTAGSYISASDKRAHFGLGSFKKAKIVEITWSSGIVQRLESVPADQILTVKEPPR